jgi:hypothetical protein
MTTLRASLASAALLFALTGAASAEVLAYGTNTEGVIVTAPTFLKPANGAAGYELMFTLDDGGNAVQPPETKALMVAFSAECAVEGAVTNYATVDITVTRDFFGQKTVTQVAPTVGMNDAFCSGNGSAALDGPAVHSYVVPVPVGSVQGFYTVTVKVSPSQKGLKVSIDDTSLVVSR